MIKNRYTTRWLTLLLSPLLAMASTPACASETAYPGLVGSTFLGGIDSDYIYATATDSDGNILIAGSSGSDDYPVTTGVYQEAKRAKTDVIVTKLASDGYTILWSTFVGGLGDDEARAMAVDDQGDVFLCGTTTSPDFPITSGAYDGSYAGGPHDGFLIQLSADGSQLLYASFLGGGGTDVPRALHLAPPQGVVIAGFTGSNDFPTTPGVVKETRSPVFPDGADGFVTKIDLQTSKLVYSTYLGTNTGTDIIYGLDLDPGGRATVAGRTLSPGYPTTAGAYDQSFSGEWDGFITQLTPDATGYAFSTFWGDTGDDDLYGIAVDSAGLVYVCGRTSSAYLTMTPGAYQPEYRGGAHDAIAGCFRADGGALLFSTFLGGVGDDVAHALVLSSADGVCLTGETDSPDFPVVGSGFPASASSGLDSYAARLVLDGGALDYAGYLGGNGSDEGQAIAIRPDGRTVIAGFTDSGDFPLVPSATSGNRLKGNGIDGFVSVLDLADPQPVSTRGASGARLALFPPVPNPVLTAATIQFQLPSPTHAAIFVRDVRGRIVRHLLKGELASGSHRVSWDGTDDRGNRLSAGVYWVELSSSGWHTRQTAVLLR